MSLYHNLSPSDYSSEGLITELIILVAILISGYGIGGQLDRIDRGQQSLMQYQYCPMYTGSGLGKSDQSCQASTHGYGWPVTDTTKYHIVNGTDFTYSAYSSSGGSLNQGFCITVLVLCVYGGRWLLPKLYYNRVLSQQVHR